MSEPAATPAFPACVAHLWIDRPKGNVLDSALCDDLRRRLAALAEDPDVRLLVVEGAGPSFSFGASVEEHLPERAEQMLRSLRALVTDLAECPVPTLAAVRGRCLGGGLEVALACDLMFLEQDATLGAPEIRLGVFAPWTTALLQSAIPRAAAAELLLTGRDISAAEALAWGIANRVVPAGELHASVAELAERHFAPRSGAALRVATQAWRRLGRGDLAARMEAMHQTYVDRVLPLHDGTEGIRAFLEKRPPRWEDN